MWRWLSSSKKKHKGWPNVAVQQWAGNGSGGGSSGSGISFSIGQVCIGSATPLIHPPPASRWLPLRFRTHECFLATATIATTTTTITIVTSPTNTTATPIATTTMVTSIVRQHI